MWGVKKFFQEESGQGMAEYGLILALVAVVVIAALTFLSGGISDIFAGVGNELSGQTTGLDTTIP